MWLFSTRKKEPKFVPKKYVIFNVDTFNTWFNEPKNGAVYAHPGIFLRMDKLDESQIHDYLVKCHGLELSEWDIHNEIIEFRKAILEDWKKKLNENK
jgi:hypothetical protein